MATSKKKAGEIYETLLRIFEIAKRERIPTYRAADPCSSGIRRPRTRASSCAMRPGASMPSRKSARICRAPSCTGRMIMR